MVWDYQSGIVIRFDNHMTSQRGGHSKIREFSYSLRFARHLFDYTRVIYPFLYSISTRKEGASRVLKTAVEDRRKRCKMLLVEWNSVFNFASKSGMCFILSLDLSYLQIFCDNHKKYGVNLHAILLRFDVFLVLCTICEKSAQGYSDLRCVVRDGGHIYICNCVFPTYWVGGCWYPKNQNSKFMSILGQDNAFKTRLQDLKKISSLNSNDMVSMLKTTTILVIPLMFAWRVWGRYNFYRLRRSIGRGKLSNILESKNQFQQLAVLIYFAEMPSKLGQFSGTPFDKPLSLLLNHK